MPRKISIVNILLIANVIVYLIDQVFHLTPLFALSYFQSPYFHWFQPVTYMFMHGGFWHIAFNMFALWMFGRFLETAWGPRRFLIYYFICGIGAAVTQEACQFIGLISPYDFTVGASGAIYGILFAFGMTFPDERMFVFPIPFPIKAKYFVIIFIAIELFEGFAAVDTVAHFAHLGGMLFGALMFIYWKRQMRTINGVHKMKVTYNKADTSTGKYGYTINYDNYDRNGKTPSTPTASSSADSAEIDRILDKVRQSGYENLTPQEKQTLFDASKK